MQHYLHTIKHIIIIVVFVFLSSCMNPASDSSANVIRISNYKPFARQSFEERKAFFSNLTNSSCYYCKSCEVSTGRNTMLVGNTKLTFEINSKIEHINPKVFYIEFPTSDIFHLFDSSFVVEGLLYEVFFDSNGNFAYMLKAQDR